MPGMTSRLTRTPTVTGSGFENVKRQTGDVHVRSDHFKVEPFGEGDGVVPRWFGDGSAFLFHCSVVLIHRYSDVGFVLVALELSKQEIHNNYILFGRFKTNPCFLSVKEH